MASDSAANDFDAQHAEAAAQEAGRAFRENLAAAERVLSDAAKSAERMIRDGVDAFRAQTAGPATEKMDEAQRFVVESINERPVTWVAAGFGVGLVLGLLLSRRGS